MKQFILAACALMASLMLMAQDIIITNDAQKIEAKILEVSKTEIKYKEKSNLDGPTFILETKEISSIIYSNGQVKVYNQPVQNEVPEKQEITSVAEEAPANVAPTIDESTAQILLLSGQTLTVQITDLKSNYVAYILDGKSYTLPASQINKVTFLQNGQERVYQHSESTPPVVAEQPKVKSSSPIIVKSDGYYYLGEKQLTKDQYLHFIHSNCQAAWESYKKGCKLWKSGWGLFGAGMGCLVVGVPMTIVGYSNLTKQVTNVVDGNSNSTTSGGSRLLVPGAIFTSLGSCFTIASIPCLAIGAKRKNNSHTIYNERCASPKEVFALKVQSSQNGLGLALAF